MAKRQKHLFIVMTAFGLVMLSGGNTPLHSTVSSRPAVYKTPPAVRSAAVVKRRARTTQDECSTLAVQATLAKARAEMRGLLPSQPADPADIGAAMNSDRRLAEGIKRTFGNSDLIKSEYSQRGECVVTLKLSVDRLQKLGRDL
jgi:hypothetical protein